jgi:hypothetical protein
MPKVGAVYGAAERRGRLGRLGKTRPSVAKITVEAVAPMTMDLAAAPWMRRRQTHSAGMSRIVSTFARRTSDGFWAWQACLAAAWLACPLAAASESDGAESVIPAAVIGESEEIILGPGTSVLPEIEVVPDGVVVEEVIAAETVPSPAEPGFLDVSARAADGMLLDDFRIDEMPFEASSGDWFWSGGWYVGGESLWMDRSRNNRRVLFEDVDQVDPARATINYTSTAQPFNVAPGARITIGKSLGRDYLDRDRSIDFIYYGGMAYEDNDGRNAAADGAFITPLAAVAPGFNGATSFTTKFNSDFNSWEWNYRLRRRLGRDQLVMSPGGNWTRHAERGWLPSLILGTRLANVNEHFTLSSSRADATEAQFSGRYHIDAGNWLLGLNIGGELISQNEFYYWGLRGRAAPALTFANTSQQAAGIDTVLTPTTGRQTVAFSDAATRTGPGFIGDLTLMAGWHITPNFALQVGYDFLWVAGMATATRQFNLDNRDVNAIDVGGQTYYNGVSFGFYGSW